MDLIDVIRAKRVHLDRLANQSGAAGEAWAVAEVDSWSPRPKRAELALLLKELADTGINIRGSSFDAIATSTAVDWKCAESVRAALPTMVFIEIKTSNQARVKPGFQGFFFALTESEISAADQLGSRHMVALFNRQTGEVQLTNIPDILARSRSLTWQVSVQL
ncbi:hypothetical protein [Sphingopyxis sp.]|uniref:hypothetical protein n=1 Tax=Sphingopyxis sp. TaxID=1908224 RepID=UPI002618731A|nr:hypothetical protein [Sphingopyxis sp.]MCW0197574.1 hypothetical protein [Sphingopyxis sp.]